MNWKHLFWAICSIVAAIGAINWGLIAIDEKYNLVDKMLPVNNADAKRSAMRTVYAIIGIFGLLALGHVIWWMFQPSFSQQ